MENCEATVSNSTDGAAFLRGSFASFSPYCLGVGKDTMPGEKTAVAMHSSHHESAEVDVVDELAERAPGTPHVQVLARLSKKPNANGMINRHGHQSSAYERVTN